jgi:hypothetical protein
MTAGEHPAESGYRVLDQTQRNAILDQEIQKCPTSVSNYKRSFAAKVRVNPSTASAVVTYGMSYAHPVAILLLGLLSLMCGGLVLPYWLFKMIFPKYNKAISVDESGVPHWRRWVSPAEWVLAVVLVGAIIYSISWWGHFFQ